MKQYEGLVISQTPQDASSEPLPFKEALGKHEGKVLNVTDLGRRRLGYPIKKISDAHVTNFEFEMSPNQVPGFMRALDLSDGILKYMITSKLKAPRVAKSRQKKNKKNKIPMSGKK